VPDIQEAVGQYDVYRAVLAEMEPARVPCLAVPRRVHDGLLAERFGQMIVSRLGLRLVIFDEQQPRVVTWIG
jgi:XisH protein